MSEAAGYFYSVILGALALSLIYPLLEGKGASAKVAKMICGVFMLFTMLRPAVNILSVDWGSFSWENDEAISQAVNFGQAAAKKDLSAIITEQVEAYILDKAKDYDAALQVEVTLSDDDIPVPVGVTIRGSISPYGKGQMKAMIENDLGIPKEDQLWS